MNESGKNPTATPSSGPGLVVLQWLTYAFWGWTLLALFWLLYIDLASMIANQDLESVIPYSIAATLVLLPISFICDWFYGRKEPAKKTGVSMVVMVIHAVIFALFGIGMLISAVLILVQLMIQGTSVSSLQIVWLLTFLISAALYALTFVRTLNPLPRLMITRWYPVVMAAIVGGFIVLGFIGPVAHAAVTKDDRTISSKLPTLVNDIDEYVDQHGTLPASLDDVSVSPSAEELVERDLVRYRPENGGAATYDASVNQDFYRYQLCVDYKEETKNTYDTEDADDTYQTSLYIYDHPEGEVCYKLQTRAPESPKATESLFST